jgi:hypothetical protein
MFTMGVLTTLGALYCGATYFVNKHFAKNAFEPANSIAERIVCGGVFLFSPITVPLGLALLIFMEVVNWHGRKEDESFPR